MKKQRTISELESDSPHSSNPTLVSMVSLQISCEVCKQLSIYSLQYFNGSRYPVPETALVAGVEGVKCAVVAVALRSNFPSFSSSSLRSSLPFVLPGLLYTVNNNIYLVGLTLVPPTIWLILCSARTVFTALIYKFVLFRPVTLLQLLGVAFIVLSLLTVKLPDLLSGANHLPSEAVYLAGAASLISVGASVYSELLFKNGSSSSSSSGKIDPEHSFLEQQFWLYFYSLLIAILMHFTKHFDYGPQAFTKDISNLSNILVFLLCFSLFFDAMGGLVVASILKYLDNVVKEYSGSVANLLTAIFCAMLFPDKFQITRYVVISLASLLFGIFLYERYRKR